MNHTTKKATCALALMSAASTTKGKIQTANDLSTIKNAMIEFLETFE